MTALHECEASSFREVAGQLLHGQLADLVTEALADAPDGARVGVDGLGRQALELQVLKMQLVVLVERVCGQGFHLEVTSWFVIERPLGKGDEATLWIRIRSGPFPPRSGFVQPAHPLDRLRRASPAFAGM